MMGLTQHQALTKRYIARHLAAKGVAPTCEQICLALRFKSKSQAVETLRALEVRGHIRRPVPGAYRRIELVFGKAVVRSHPPSGVWLLTEGVKP